MSSHRYRFKVTQEDIDAGVRNQSAHCIVATALGMQIPEATRIMVDAQTIRFSIGKERLTFLTPRSVQEYVIAFDAGEDGDFKPMEVVIDNPMITQRRPPTASRLIVKGGEQPPRKAKTPSATRWFGQRVFRVNRQKRVAQS